MQYESTFERENRAHRVISEREFPLGNARASRCHRRTGCFGMMLVSVLFTTGHGPALATEGGGLGFAATPIWQLGVSGYVYKQVTDDKLNGQVVGDGNQGRAVAIGPFIRYHPSPDWGITLKWQHETMVENRASGDRVFLQFAVKLW